MSTSSVVKSSKGKWNTTMFSAICEAFPDGVSLEGLSEKT